MYAKIQHGQLLFPPFTSEPCKALIVAVRALRRIAELLRRAC
jgi:hypothetical protein